MHPVTGNYQRRGEKKKRDGPFKIIRIPTQLHSVSFFITFLSLSFAVQIPIS